MWVLKIKMDCEKFTIGPVAKRFQIDIYGLPLGYEKKKKHLELNAAGIFIGDEDRKNKLIKFLKKKQGFFKVEEQNGFYITLTKQALEYEKLYQPKLIQTKPNFISKEGYIIWELASWNKKSLDEVVKYAKKYHKGKILKFKQEKLKTITFQQPFAKLTEKQKKALELAIHQGYYTFPRKISLHQLAKKAKQSYSTFQEHLRKSESKIIPFLKKT